MADGKIYITISDTRTGENGGGGTPEQPKEKEKDKHKSVGEFARHEFYNLIKSQATNVVNYSIGNIGNFTGDYNAQRSVQVGLRFAEMGLKLGNSFVAGMTITGGNVVGGVVAMGVALSGMIVENVMQDYSNKVQTKNQNYEISQLRDISGLNTLTNGGR